MSCILPQGLEDADAVGEDYNVDEADDGPRPFTALLDTGLKRTSTGSKVFAALKVGSVSDPEYPKLQKHSKMLEVVLRYSMLALAWVMCLEGLRAAHRVAL
jgi:Ribosomal large subunit proteins 60S L5, and 50S L18